MVLSNAKRFDVLDVEDNFLLVCVSDDTTEDDVISNANERFQRLGGRRLAKSQRESWNPNPCLCSYDNVSLHYALECLATANQERNQE